MIAGGNVVGKWSKMGGEEGLRTVECLRGRLLAERVTSRVAKQDADQMANKVIELEDELRIEMKSRNRAEKRLKYLMKKLEFLNISYVSDESENSSMLEKSEISSVSSTPSSSTKQPQYKQPNTPITNPRKCYNTASNGQNLGSTFNAICENSAELESTQNCRDSKTDDDHSLKSSIEDKEINGENDENLDDNVDNLLALVPVDMPIEAKIIPNASVKDVLDALRYAREKLQNSMERRQIIRVGSR